MRKNNQLRAKTSYWQKVVFNNIWNIPVFVIIEIGLRIGGFALLFCRNTRQAFFKPERRLSDYVLGESTTRRQYPRFLEEILNQRNTGIKFSVIDKGLSGVHTEVILSQLENNLDIYKPDMVVAMIGVNDFSWVL